ncbi:hypothetical protein SAMN05444273_101438 [Litoreibacter ascidiaceicola]|uniref:Uncharacterized protein n=1 Tax=Litoreibacter ascidiaceicola TaxID=1486859 RepID=A0A1M4TJH7_9RHOB|nr:hypothetical protein SAMN05444273_101438 [Litoreibacter ascidiaceicola]
MDIIHKMENSDFIIPIWYIITWILKASDYLCSVLKN